MKVGVVFSQSAGRLTTAWYVAGALQSMGHNVVPIDIRQEIKPPLDLVIKVDDTFPWQSQHASILDFPQRVFWMLDSNQPSIPRCLEIASHFSHIACAQKEAIALVEQNIGRPAIWLPYGCDPDGVGAELKVERDVDVGFVGGVGKDLHRGRYQAFKLLHHFFPSMLVDTSKDPTKISQVYSRCKAVVNLCAWNDLNMRFFEATSCGALVLQEVSERLTKFNGLDEIAKPDVHYIPFTTMREAIERLGFFLKHKTRSREIAKRAQKLVRSKHTYKHRMEALLDFVGEGEEKHGSE